MQESVKKRIFIFIKMFIAWGLLLSPTRPTLDFLLEVMEGQARDGINLIGQVGVGIQHEGNRQFAIVIHSVFSFGICWR